MWRYRSPPLLSERKERKRKVRRGDTRSLSTALLWRQPASAHEPENGFFMNYHSAHKLNKPGQWLERKVTCKNRGRNSQHSQEATRNLRAAVPNLFSPMDRLGKAGHPLRACACMKARRCSRMGAHAQGSMGCSCGWAHTFVHA